VDTPPPTAIDTQSLATVLAERWSIAATDLRYVPKGVGAYHWRVECSEIEPYFVTVDDLSTKPWLGREPDATFEGLVAAYATAWTLHHDEGLPLVVPPIRAGDGSIAVRFDERYSVAVFQYVDGAAGTWGESMARDERVQLVHDLARLHEPGHARRTGIARRPHVLPERDALADALDSLDQPWTAGAYSERARRALSDNTTSVVERLARFDELAVRLDRAGQPPVVTHGEPHPGNLIVTSTGLRLIDWDTVALAEPERDLWMLYDDGRDVVDVYTEATGHDLDPSAIEFYALAWTMSDIASFAEMFRFPHESTQWAEQKFAGFVALLEGGTSTPYGSST
jgi:spectinomycin phosphotransferase